MAKVIWFMISEWWFDNRVSVIGTFVIILAFVIAGIAFSSFSDTLKGIGAAFAVLFLFSCFSFMGYLAWHEFRENYQKAAQRIKMREERED